MQTLGSICGSEYARNKDDIFHAHQKHTLLPLHPQLLAFPFIADWL